MHIEQYMRHPSQVRLCIPLASTLRSREAGEEEGEGKECSDRADIRRARDAEGSGELSFS